VRVSLPQSAPPIDGVKPGARRRRSITSSGTSTCVSSVMGTVNDWLVTFGANVRGAYSGE
jgi:hypothetical protein